MNENVKWQHQTKVDNIVFFGNTNAPFSLHAHDINFLFQSLESTSLRAQQNYFDDMKRALKPSERVLQIDYADVAEII